MSNTVADRVYRLERDAEAFGLIALAAATEGDAVDSIIDVHEDPRELARSLVRAALGMLYRSTPEQRLTHEQLISLTPPRDSRLADWELTARQSAVQCIEMSMSRHTLDD